MECPGGGGDAGSGKIDYPAHQEEIQWAWLDTGDAGDETALGNDLDLITAINTAQAGDNPYTDAFSYPPDVELARIQSRFDKLDRFIDGYDEMNSFDRIARRAKSIAQGMTFGTAEIAEAVTQFSARQTAEYLRAANTLDSSLASINAVQSSTFTLGKANLLSEKTRQVAAFNAQLSLQLVQEETAITMQNAGLMVNLLNGKLQLNHGAAALQSEIGRQAMVAKYEQSMTDIDIDVKDAVWDLSMFEYGANMLGANTGGGRSPQERGLGPVKSALAGAMSGAAAVSALQGATAAGTGGLFSAAGAAGTATLAGGSGITQGVAAGALGGPPGMLIGAAIGAGLSLLLSN